MLLGISPELIFVWGGEGGVSAMFKTKPTQLGAGERGGTGHLQSSLLQNLKRAPSRPQESLLYGWFCHANLESIGMRLRPRHQRLTFAWGETKWHAKIAPTPRPHIGLSDYLFIRALKALYRKRRWESESTVD